MKELGWGRSHQACSLRLMLLSVGRNLRKWIREHIRVCDEVRLDQLRADKVTEESCANGVPTRIPVYPVRRDAVDRCRTIDV